MKGLLDKLIYLSLGLSFVLIFIGVKLIRLWAHEIWSFFPKIETGTSLYVIGAILTISIVASLIKLVKTPTALAHAGRVTSKKDPEAGDRT